MGDVDLSIIAQRLTSLRKHLGDRENDKLSIQDLADKAGIPEYKMVRLEHGKGSLESFITLLLYYRSKGYNIDWILSSENENIPMILSSSNDLMRITEMVKMLTNRLQSDYKQITGELKEMGYSPVEDKLTITSGTEVPQVFEFS